MSQSSVRGSITLRKLRTGATASVSLSSTMQLFQLYSIDTSGNAHFAPEWTGAAGTYPVVTVNAAASQGTVTVTNVLWKINSTLASTIPGVSEVVSGGAHSLHINANLGQQSILNYNSGTLAAEITIQDASGATQTVTKTEVIRIQQAVSNGYNVMINCTKAYVDETTSTANPTTLKAVCYRGLELVTSGITFKWYNSTDSGATELGTGDTYDITDPDKVDGSQLFICRAFDGTNTEVDAEGILIVDNSDPYYIVASAQQSKGGSVAGIPQQDNATSVNVASDYDATEVTFKVQNANGTDYGTVASWSAEKRHADTMKLIKQRSASDPYTTDPTAAEETAATPTDSDSYNTATATNAASVSISVYDADYVSIGNPDSPVAQHDTEVIVTATATL